MIDWQKIETVLLDMDGTLLDLHYDNYFWNEYLPDYYATRKNMSKTESRQILMEKFRAKLGALEFYCIDYWSQELDIELLPIKTALKDRIQFLPGAKELLHFLKANTFDTVLVTNAHRDILQLKNETIGIESFVDTAYASHDFGLPKEDPAFWHRFAKTHTFNPEKTVLIDDNLAVLKSAQLFNIATLILPLNPDSQRPAQTMEIPPPFVPVQSLQELLI